MKTESRPASSSYCRSSATGSGYNSESSSATRQPRVSSASRANSSTYFDIANTILGSAGDLDDLLLNAARDGDYNKVEQLLVKRGEIIVDIDCKDKRTGNTALIWAAKKGHNKILQLLLRHGADPTLRNYNAKTALEEATGATLTMLLDSVARATESSHRLLLQAAWQGNVEVVRRLLSNKVLDINCQNAEGLTPLMLVARDIQMFEKLSRDLNTSYNPVEVAQELMKARANIHARDNDGRSCLHYASQSMATVADKLVQTFIDGGSEPAQLDKRQYMPIHWASQHGNTNVVMALLDGGSEVNCRGFIGLTPLHISAHNDNQMTAITLLQHGADVTLTDDRGFTPVDLAKTRKLKTILKEAWTEATQKNSTTELAPVRATPSREGGSRLARREDSPSRKKGEVIFDGMPANPFGSQRSSPAGRPNANRQMLGGPDRSRRGDRQMIQEIESGRYTPTFLQSRENTRLLGTVRNKPGPPVLPNISKGIAVPGPGGRQSPETPVTGRRSSQGEEIRRSLEDGRNMLVQRSNAKRASFPSRGQLNKTTPDRIEFGEESSSNISRHSHRRTGSDPFLTNISEMASTLEAIINRRGRSVSTGETGKSDLHLLTSSRHKSPLRTPIEREACVNIPTTIPEGNSPGNSTNTITFENEFSAARRSTVPTQMMSLPPTSSRILPPTPTFVTQRSYSNLDSALARMAMKDDDSSSSKEPSPRSDEENSDNKVRIGVSNPMELLRSRSLLKEEFILAESRPSDSFMASSGSDPTSSSSSLSTASSSPRDGAIGQGRSAYRRNDPSLLTLTLRDKAMKGTGFRRNELSVPRKSEKSGSDVEKSPIEADIPMGRTYPVSSSSSKNDTGAAKVTRSQSLRMTQRQTPQQQNEISPDSAANLKRSQSIGSVVAESTGKQSSATPQPQGSTKGAPFSGKGLMVIMRDTYSDFDNLMTANSTNFAQNALHPLSSSGPVQISAKKCSSPAHDKVESVYIKENTVAGQRSRHNSSEQAQTERSRHNSETSRMSVSDVAISGINQIESGAATDVSHALASSQAVQKLSSCTSVSKPPVPNSQSNKNSNLCAGQKTVASPSSNQGSRESKGASQASVKSGIMLATTASPSSKMKVDAAKSSQVMSQSSSQSKAQANCTDNAGNKSSITNSCKDLASSVKALSSGTKLSPPVSETQIKSKGKVDVSKTGSPKQGNRIPSSSSMTSSTNAISGNSSLSKSAASKPFSSVSSSRAAAQSDSPSLPQKSASSNQSLAIRKSVSTESLASQKPGSSTQGKPPSRETSKQHPLNSSLKNLSASTRDISRTVSASESKTSGNSGPTASSSDLKSCLKSDVSSAGKNSDTSAVSKPASNSTVKNASKTVPPASKPQTAQTTTSKPSTPSVASPSSKSSSSISAATPTAVAKVMQTVANVMASPRTSASRVRQETKCGVSTSVTKSSPSVSGSRQSSTSGVLRKSVGLSSSANFQGAGSNKTTVVSVSVDRTGKSGQTGHSGAVDLSSSLSASPVSKSSPSLKSARETKTGTNTPSRSSSQLKSRPESVLTENAGDEESSNLSGEGIEPLVKITYGGMNAKPSANVSRYTDPAVTVNTGPVIVNPFEHLADYQTPRDNSPAEGVYPSEAGCVVGKDAAGRKRPQAAGKCRQTKGGKKGKDVKRPVSGTSRQPSAGKRRGAKSKDAKAGETDEARPKSGKRVKSGKRRGKKAEKEADKEAALLREMAAKGNVALISGIGWHMATDCADTSDIGAATKMHIDSSDSDLSDAESIEDAEALMQKSRPNFPQASPRFREIKYEAEKTDALKVIPSLTCDGFPPMNLDVTQKDDMTLKYVMASADGDDSDASTNIDDMNDDVNKELLLRKLTPIPEMPSISGPVGNVAEVIARFDRSLKGNQLSDMLEGTPRNENTPVSQNVEVSADSRETSGREVVSRKNSSKEAEKVLTDKNVIKPPRVEVTKPPSSKERSSPRRTQSLKEGNESEKKEKRRRERKFSESKKDADDEIDDAIEEILSATNTSMSSTLKSTSTLKSGSNTLTEGDRSLLLKLKTHSKESPFHASKKSNEDDDDDASTLVGENSGGSSGEGLCSDTNPNLLRVVHAEHFEMGAKVKAMIDAGADENKIKAMMSADDVKEQEAIQIVKVMNSFRHMELHAGGSPHPREPLVRSESHRVSKVAAALDKVPLVRPSSAGAARSRGKFHELKKSSAGGSAQHLADKNKGEPDDSIGEGIGAHGGYAAVVEALAGDVARDVLGDTAGSETMCSRLSRHSSRSGSASTHDSQEEETIQWKKGNVLGKGAFGTVWCGLTSEGELIAVKQIELTTTDRQKAEREYEKVQEEVELLKTLNHINIVGYLGTSLEDSTVSIFMQFVPGGSIASILARFGTLDEAVFRRYTRQILQGVEYLHENDVIHRDIKGGNVMLMPTGIIKLIDFGCAKRLCINLSLSQSQILRSMKGTPYWMAPEVVNESGHGKKSDIWSIGCTVFEMATRKPPWADMNPMAAIFAIGSDRAVPKLPDKFSAEAIAFVNRCLTRNQQERPSATELLTDVFMAEQQKK